MKQGFSAFCKSKRTLIALAGFAIISLFAQIVLNYFYGFYGMPYWLLLAKMVSRLLACAFGLFLIVIACPLLSIIFINSLVRNTKTLRLAGMVAALSALSGFLLVTCDTNNLVVYGISKRMSRDYRSDVLREFAHDFDRLPISSQTSFLPGKVYMNADLDGTGLKVKYPFLLWMKDADGSGGPSGVGGKK